MSIFRGVVSTTLGEATHSGMLFSYHVYRIPYLAACVTGRLFLFLNEETARKTHLPKRNQLDTVDERNPAQHLDMENLPFYNQVSSNDWPDYARLTMAKP